ncbi:MAG: adenylosuccinate synthetase [Firmicutes bacterium ML8_F2]|jgi:adenylosuccinate synthase|nr:MAG: adenylosuccinate synthetase [Firmicutes bacterium ML8_F2]
MVKNDDLNRLVIVGAQWGDEGKGKVIDFLAAQADVVARFQGGDNAGHTVVYGANVFKLHHIPSGILNPHTLCLLGNGMVINPQILVRELEDLEKRLIKTDNLRISGKAHLIMAYHQAMDEANEKMLGEKKIGTTGRGIGPAYADKALRRGIRAVDMLNFSHFCEWLAEILPLQNKILQEIYGQPGFKYEELCEFYRPLCDRLRPLIIDTDLLLAEEIENKKRILFEGAQGALLDIDHGTYPFVTSSSTVAAYASAGTGVGIGWINNVIGVLKAYTTRVGEGPFLTEEKGETGAQIRERGNEYGTTTGRPRRCGWFDSVIGRYAARVNGLTGLAVTKLDVLSGMDVIRMAVAYRCRGEIIRHFPMDPSDMKECEPVYEDFPGWDEDLSNIRKFKDLPPAAQYYLQAMEEAVGVRMEIVSVGPDRSQTIICPESPAAVWMRK